LYRYWARLDPPGCPMPSQPDRGTERSRPLEDLAERPKGRDPLKTWPRDREAETFWRLGRETETVEDSTETAEGHGYLADGRPSP